MKKLLSTLAIAAASTALAVESSNTFGILRVDSSAAQTIVSIPWEAAGGGSIKVKDVVKTANLTPESAEPAYIGDQLYYYDTSAETPAYKMWHLTSTGWEGVASVEGSKITAAAGGDDVLSRGGAIILVRKNPTVTEGETTKANPFYLYGQYNSGDVTVEVNRNETNPTYTLMAPPKTADNTTVNSGTWTGFKKGDALILPSTKRLSWNDTNKWSTYELDNASGDMRYVAATDPIPAGEGVWVIVGAGDGKVSVAW